MCATNGNGIDRGGIGDIFAKDYRWGDCSQDFKSYVCNSLLSTLICTVLRY